MTDLVSNEERRRIIDLFREERNKLEEREKECRNLLSEVEQVLGQALELQKLYLYISPKTSQLHSECKNIIQERNDLRDSYEKINKTLNKQEELRGTLKRLPDIKNQISAVLNTVYQNYQISSKQHEGIPLDEYYGRFFAECRKIKDLTSQLESCLSTTSRDELLLNLEEIYTLYFDIREQLIGPIFTRNLTSLVSRSNRNYCDLLQHTCGLLTRTIRNEIQLFYQIFPSTTANLKKQALNIFLELLCKTFYEQLRPVVIHINHLETLAELYKFLVETVRPDMNEDIFQNTMSMLAEDIQERMIFRAEVFMKESVLDYSPSSGDLAYPEKLELLPNGGELKDYQSMWYPTVQRTVLALYYLDRVFDNVTFLELAQEVVLACLRSLDLAQRLIDQRHGGTKIEATLFLSKHLTIVRDQLQSYGIDKVQFSAPSRADPSKSEVVTIDTSQLGSLLDLYQCNQLPGATTDNSLWSQLNETIINSTRWTLKATTNRFGRQ